MHICHDIDGRRYNRLRRWPGHRGVWFDPQYTRGLVEVELIRCVELLRDVLDDLPVKVDPNQS